MIDNDDLSLDDQIQKYSISWFIIHVANVGVTLFISAWNQHTIPGRRRGLMPRGIPDMLMLSNNHTQRISINLLPNGDQAAELYRQSGGHLSDPELFGMDPIGQNREKILIRQAAFSEKYNSFDVTFHELVKGSTAKFKDALLYCIDITKRLSAS
jgi:hypothetical protein